MNKIKKKKDNSIIPVIETKRMKQRTTHYSPVTRGHSSAFVLLVRFDSIQFNSIQQMVREMSSQIVDVKKKPYFIRKLTKLMNFCTAMSCFFFSFSLVFHVSKKKKHTHTTKFCLLFFSPRQRMNRRIDDVRKNRTSERMS